MPFGARAMGALLKEVLPSKNVIVPLGLGNGFPRAGCSVRLNGCSQSYAGTHGDGGRAGCQSRGGAGLPGSHARKPIEQ
jgi:hypothetical protein